MAPSIPKGSIGGSRPEGLTWGRAGCGKTARPVREGRGKGDRPLTLISVRLLPVGGTTRSRERANRSNGTRGACLPPLSEGRPPGLPRTEQHTRRLSRLAFRATAGDPTPMHYRDE